MERSARVDRVARLESMPKHTKNPLVHSMDEEAVGRRAGSKPTPTSTKASSSAVSHSFSMKNLVQITAISLICSIIVQFSLWGLFSLSSATPDGAVLSSPPTTKPAYIDNAVQPQGAQISALASDSTMAWEVQLFAATLAGLRTSLDVLGGQQIIASKELQETRALFSTQLHNLTEAAFNATLAQVAALEAVNTGLDTKLAALNRTLFAAISSAEAKSSKTSSAYKQDFDKFSDTVLKNFSSFNRRLISQQEYSELASYQISKTVAEQRESFQFTAQELSGMVNEQQGSLQLAAQVIKNHTGWLHYLTVNSKWVESIALAANSSASEALGQSNSARQAVEAANINSPLLQGATEQVESLKYMVAELGQHAIIADERDESLLRSSGGSGVTSSRGTGTGSHPYHTASWSTYHASFLSIHDHADIRDTIGMGELEAVMNGVNFKTRHNDYRLLQPSVSSEVMKRTSSIDFPPVPPTVLAFGSNVTAQILEMKEYFRAWSAQDESIRDYKPYFKPVLSYMEGWWGVDSNFEEPFDSDRHKVAADSWAALYDRVRLLEQHGWKDSGENIPWLPSKMWGLRDGVAPQLARWNYRILAVPLKDDLELSRFVAEPDLQVQLSFLQPQTTADLFKTRAARFRLNKYIGENKAHIETERYSRSPMYSYLDDLMAQIPGLDNFSPSTPPQDDVVYDSRLGNETAFNYNDRIEKLDSRFYNRYFSVSTAGAMGTSFRRRGWNDDNLWVASTSQESVAALKGADGRLDRKSYALPLEVIYMTPLAQWNPYNLTIHADNTYGLPVRQGRNGSLTNPQYAYDGVDRRNFYLTPVEFFGDLSSDSAADTSVTPVGVISDRDAGTSREGTVYKVAASGHWIHLPKIPGVEQIVPVTSPRLRQRYPIAPARPTSKTVWQEIKALQAVMSDGDSWKVNEGLEPLQTNVRYYETGGSVSTGFHSHRFYLTESDRDVLAGGEQVTRRTFTGNMHQHTLVLQLDASPDADPAAPYKIVECDDSAGSQCAPGHDHGGMYRATI